MGPARVPERLFLPFDYMCMHAGMHIQCERDISSIWISAAPLVNLAITYGLVAIM